MATTKRKAARPQEAEEAADLSNVLTWTSVEHAAEVYWPGLGGRVVQQIVTWNSELFDDALAPAPIVLSPTSSIFGHWFPCLDRAIDPRYGYGAASRPQPLLAVRRSDVVRGMMLRQLREQGHNGRTNSEAWRELVMRTHERLAGQKIWCAPLVERREGRGQPVEEEGVRIIQIERTVREQVRCPKTGGVSLSPAEISAWPLNVVELGNIERQP